MLEGMDVFECLQCVQVFKKISLRSLYKMVKIDNFFFYIYNCFLNISLDFEKFMVLKHS